MSQQTSAMDGTTLHDTRPGLLRLGAARTGIEVKQFFRERDSVVFTSRSR